MTGGQDVERKISRENVAGGQMWRENVAGGQMWREKTWQEDKCGERTVAEGANVEIEP